MMLPFLSRREAALAAALQSARLARGRRFVPAHVLQLEQQIGSSALDKSFHLSNAAVEVAGRAGPAAPIEGRFRADLEFEPIQDRKQLLGREFLCQQFFEPVQESGAQVW